MCTEGWHCHLHQPSSNLIDLIAGWGKRLHERLEGRMERLLPSPDVSPLGCAMVPKWWAYSALDWSTRCPIKVQVEPEQVCTCQRSLVFGCYVPKPHLNLSLLPALLFIFSTVSMYSPFTFIHSFRIYIYILRIVCLALCPEVFPALLEGETLHSQLHKNIITTYLPFQ